MDPDKESRAARRRAVYSGQIVRLGDPKPGLYAGKTPIERLALQTALVRRQALLSGSVQPAVPRAEWPGETFDIDDRNRRLR